MSETLPCNPVDVAARLLAWYAESGRDLPWRGTRDPYRVWLSEIMLQQTTVAAVIPYYERFLEAFPDIESLAAAPVETVIELWAGLGYYRRARNLHAAAKQVVEDYGGRFPDTPEAILALPGIGRSTAGAILSIAFDRPAPVLDGNVRRVLCRLFALREPPRSRSAEKKLWCWAEMLTPPDRPHDYAQAIMDLGATVCVPGQPLCDACPLAGICRGYALGLAHLLPVRQQTRKVPTIRRVVLAVQNEDRLLVRRRPLDGMLAGLWELPEAELMDDETADQAARRLAQSFGAHNPQRVGQVRHAYSHFRLELELWRATTDPSFRVGEGESRWVPISAIDETPLHGAHKKAFKLLDSTS
ncbi:MAG: A/G-specific adenine glycosylase [Geothermobacteraceae bacterium]